MRIPEEPNLITSSILGISRGLFVHSLIYPLDVVKIRAQNSSEKSHKIAAKLFKEEGIRGFYRGLSPQLVKTSIKQAWVWPIITTMPQTLDRYEIGDFQKQAMTGMSIAIIDASVTTPLERAKILSAASSTKKYSVFDMYKEGWRGYSTHLSKLSVNWVVFLTAQKHLRDQQSAQSKEKLSLPQLAKIGVQVAFIVSLAAAPFDVANTLKQTQNIGLLQLLSQRNFSRFYRGFPLNFLGLTIHNIASIVLIDRIGN